MAVQVCKDFHQSLTPSKTKELDDLEKNYEMGYGTV